MYVRLIDGVASYYTITDLRRDNPDTSFPIFPSDDALASFNVYPCQSVEQPTIINGTQRLERGTPEYDGYLWKETWNIIDLTTEELEIRDNNARLAVKQQASELLNQTDYLDLPNTSNKVVNIEEIRTYRNALRLIATNPTAIVDWPIRPQTVWSI